MRLNAIKYDDYNRYYEKMSTYKIREMRMYRSPYIM